MKQIDVIQLDDFAYGVYETITDGFVTRLMIEDRDIWEESLAQVDRRQYVSVRCKYMTLIDAYYYNQSVYEKYEDISFIIYQDKKPIVLWPMCIMKKNGKIRIGSAAGGLLPPIFLGNTKSERQRKIIDVIVGNIKNLYFSYGGDNDYLFFRETYMNDLSSFSRKMLENGAIHERTIWNAFVDLDLDYEEIIDRIRRTNKYSIRKGLKEFHVSIYDENSPDLEEQFDAFHSMHTLVSGRETRCQETWEIEYLNIKNGNSRIGSSFIVCIRDGNEKLVGASYFDASNSAGLYSSAVYDRSLFDKPISHVSQSEAIKRFKQNGVKWYEIGERIYPGDYIDKDDKILNISHFKEGFATNLFPTIYWKIHLSNL